MESTLDFQFLFESSPCLLLVLNTDMHIVAATNSYLEAIDSSLTAILGKEISEVFPDTPEDQQNTRLSALYASLERVLSTKKPDKMPVRKCDLHRTRKSGDRNERYWSYSNIPLLNDDGSIRFIVHQAEDISNAVELKYEETKWKISCAKLERAEKKLQESKKRFESIFDHCFDAILLASPDGTVAVANAQSSEMFGYSEQELCELGLNAILDLALPEVKTAFRESQQKGQFRGELSFRHRNGAPVQTEVSFSIFNDEKGNKWTSIFIHDISQRKKAEQEKKFLLEVIDAKRRWLEAVIERAPMGILLVHVETEEIMIPNQRAMEMFGPDVYWAEGRKAVLGLVSMPDNCGPLEFKRLASNRALMGETITGEEQLICRRDGRKVPVLVNAGPITDALGRITGAVIMYQDISELKKAQSDSEKAIADLNREKRWLEAVFEGAPVGMLMFRSEDPDHPLPNALIRERIGSRIDWSKGRLSYLRLLYDKDGKPLPEEKILSTRILSGETIVGEEQILRFPDGRELPILAAGGPIKDSAGRMIGAVEFFQDISVLKELEHLREEWSAIIAHDLRQPITAIHLSAELLKTLPGINKEILEMSEMIESSSKQLNRMTNDLLQFSQLEAKKLKLELQETDLEKLLNQIVKKLTPVFCKNPIELDFAANIPPVIIDPGRIEQVIGNLISNGSKYGFPETRITLRARLHGKCVCISVSNEGEGLKDDDARKVFQRFRRTNKALKGGIQGIGLGLYITKGLVEAHGGRITVKSIPGKTTTFTFELPVSGPH